jgi:hypothetical protein
MTVHETEIEAETSGPTGAYRVHGSLLAICENGVLVRWEFTPAAGDAGYFGTEIDNVEGDELPTEGDECYAAFWSIVQVALAACTIEPTEPTTFAVQWWE